MRKIDRQLMRQINTRLLLSLLREHGSLSQSDLVRHTGLSPATVTNIVRQLREGEMVVEARGDAVPNHSVGRRPVMLRLNPDAQVVLACELQPDELRMALLDIMGNVVMQRRLKTPAGRRPASIISKIVRFARKMVEQQDMDLSRLVGMGICTHGLIDVESGRVRLSLPLGWRDVALGEMLGAALDMPVAVWPLGRAMAYSEYRAGAGKEVDCLAVIEVDAGIGMEVIEGDRFVRGAHQMAGELGQTIVDIERDEQGRLVGHTLESLACGRAIIERLGRAATSGDETARRILKSRSLRSALQGFFEACDAGHVACQAIIDDVARCLGAAIANVVNLFDPGRVVLTGSVVEQGESQLLNRIRESACGLIVGSDLRPVDITVGHLGQLGAMMGVALGVFDSLFKVDLGQTERLAGGGDVQSVAG
jgi:predicted NBD/HSP70 family sugar kinase